MWIDVDGLDNLRDLGGTPTSGGACIRPGRLWRSENHTGIPESSKQRLVALGLTDVVDLRSDFEIGGSPSPFADVDGVSYHHHSFFKQAVDDDVEVLDQALPWLGYLPHVVTGDATADSYLAFLADRPDSVLAALRAIAAAPGAALVHCAAGKDRTGLTVALALHLVGVDTDEIAADYARTTERILSVVDRLWGDSTYADSNSDRSLDVLAARPEAMLSVIAHLQSEYGGARRVLTDLGWSSADDEQLKAHLLG